MRTLNIGDQISLTEDGFAGCVRVTATVEKVDPDGTAYYRRYPAWSPLEPVPGTAPTRRGARAYYEARFDYYRTMDLDYSSAAELGRADTDTRFPQFAGELI
jgi:hypothetical protein